MKISPKEVCVLNIKMNDWGTFLPPIGRKSTKVKNFALWRVPPPPQAQLIKEICHVRVNEDLRRAVNIIKPLINAASAANTARC